MGKYCLTLLAAAAVGCAAPGSGVGGGAEAPAGSNLVIRWHRGDGETPAKVEVLGMSAADLDALSARGASADGWVRVLAVYVESEGGEGEDAPAVVGDYEVTDRGIRFVPRYPLVAGVRYRAVYRSATSGEAEPIEARFMIPERSLVPTTVVEQVYPTADELPENQLKFYIYFSAAMSRGMAYDHIRLREASGRVVDLPFLEIDEELWDASGRRLTVFFDPGRVKRELLPREQEGPALAAGKRYTLEIDSGWEDAEGVRLKSGFRKAFRVGIPDYASPQPTGWRLDVPAAGGKEPLVVAFGEALDRALLDRVLWVIDSEGAELAGKGVVGEGESSWRFVPEEPWREGDHRLVVETTLEDLAGNSVGRLFEVDVVRPVERQVNRETVELRFTVSAKASGN